MNEPPTAQVIEQPEPPINGNDVRPASPAPEARTSYTAVLPQVGCATCGGAAGMTVKPSFVYGIGRVGARFTNLAAEKEFAQATGRSDTAGKTDQQTMHAVLAKRENRYLARQLCWVLSIQGLETYLLVPRDPADIDRLIESIRPVSNPNDIDWSLGYAVPSRRRRCVTG